MITAEIVIKEQPNGKVAVAVNPNQETATREELKVASLINQALEALGELCLAPGDSMLAGTGVRAQVEKAISEMKKS
jgi:tRNA pseudouridine-54 N-methylase